MKNFLIRAIIFLIIPIVSYSIILCALKFSFNNDISQYSIIILGDSQTEFIHDSEMYNQSIKGSPFFVHFKFSEEFIEQLKGKRIYIACNYHNLSKLYQNRLLNDSLFKGWTASMFRHLDEYHILNYKYPEIRPKDLEYSLFDIEKPAKILYNKFVKKQPHNTRKSISNDTLSISDDIQRHWNNSDYILQDSIQRTYLKKLITLLKENDCEVVLLKMPLTNYYIENVPIEIKNELSELANKYKIRILDLNKELNISSEYKYFKDYGHLNKSGDSLVMDYFKKNEIIQKTKGIE